MAILTCKICGGTLEISENKSVAVCEYCGRTQTLPKFDDETRMRKYERANHHRRNNDYDKAMSIYESILDEDVADSEAYWSLVLCRYGIVYVEDKKIRKHIPTMNRVQYTSILADEDYKSALQYADIYQKQIYENDAKESHQIQKRFLEISQKEEPFDVFISYKDKDDLTGQPTQDRAIAMEIYNRLHRENLKVFFSHFTLDNKLGEEFEPYIFSALNSAKVMIVLGTKKEYFEAKWVRNEWSRFHALIQNGAKKTLIAAYKNMDAYDLPAELDMQAQDMDKMGFLENLVYVICRDIERYAEKKPAISLPPTQNNKLKDVQYDLKNIRYDVILNGFGSSKLPCIKAVREYFGYGLAEAKAFVESYNPKLANNVSTEEAQNVRDFFQNRGFSVKLVPLTQSVTPVASTSKQSLEPVDIDVLLKRARIFLEDGNWSSANQYAEKVLNQNPEHAEAYLIKLLEEYKISKMEHLARVNPDFQNSINYKRLLIYADESTKKEVEKCLAMAKEGLYNHCVKVMNQAKTEQDYRNAALVFRPISGYKDVDSLVAICRKKEQETLNQENKYISANNYLNKKDYKNAYSLFSQIGDYKDSEQKAKACEQKQKQLEDFNKAEERLESLLRESRNNLENAKEERNSLNSGYRYRENQLASIANHLNEAKWAVIYMMVLILGSLGMFC